MRESNLLRVFIFEFSFAPLRPSRIEHAHHPAATSLEIRYPCPRGLFPFSSFSSVWLSGLITQANAVRGFQQGVPQNSTKIAHARFFKNKKWCLCSTRLSVVFEEISKQIYLGNSSLWITWMELLFLNLFYQSGLAFHSSRTKKTILLLFWWWVHLLLSRADSPLFSSSHLLRIQDSHFQQNGKRRRSLNDFFKYTGISGVGLYGSIEISFRAWRTSYFFWRAIKNVFQLWLVVLVFCPPFLHPFGGRHLSPAAADQPPKDSSFIVAVVKKFGFAVVDKGIGFFHFFFSQVVSCSKRWG